MVVPTDEILAVELVAVMVASRAVLSGAQRVVTMVASSVAGTVGNWVVELVAS